MKRMKKLLALLLVVSLSLPVMSGCGKSDGPITLTVYSQLANTSGQQVGWFAAEILERFNVVMNIVPDADGVYETRMESGNLGDIVVWGSDGTQYQEAANKGMLYDWNADNLLQEYGTYIYENMPYALEKNAGLTESGAVYGFGHNVAASAGDHEDFFYTWDIRWDLYKELGYPEVKNLDDYIEVMKDMKEIYPLDQNGNETYAVTLWPDWDGRMVMYVKAMATAYYGYDELALGLYDYVNGVFHPALEEGGPYLEMLRFFNKLYQNDLLDPNSMTGTYDTMAEKVRAGGTFFSIFNYSGSAAFNKEENLANNQMMCPLVPSEATPIAYGMSLLGGNRVWTIGSSTEYPELCMEIINWLATPQGYMTYLYGPEGDCWYYDEEGNTHFTELGETFNANRQAEVPAELGGGTFNDGVCGINNSTWSIDAENPDSNGETYNNKFWKSRQLAATYEIDQDWRTFMGVETPAAYMETTNYTVAPASTYAEAKTTEEFDFVLNAVTDCLVTESWNAIYATSDEEFDEIVARMIDSCNRYGYDEVVAWSQENADRRRALELEYQ